MKHKSEKDLAWKANDLTIEYSGPAHLVVREKDKTVYTRKILFVKGAPKQIENSEGILEEAPLKLLAAGTARPLSGEESFTRSNPVRRPFCESRREAGSSKARHGKRMRR
ncbi:hypothetical protein MASR2M17_01500 [Aminivibrio sp.]